MEQARAWDLVLCLNRRQVAFGPPADTLTLPVLEATYGGAIVVLPEARAPAPRARGSSRPTITMTVRPCSPCSTASGERFRTPGRDDHAARVRRDRGARGVGGTLGCWIVLFELSYSAESFSHAMFPGLVVAALAGASLVLGGAAGLAVAAIAIALAGRAPEIGSDTAVAVVVSSLFGLGALLALSASSPPGLGSLLFGDVLGVSDLDLISRWRWPP